jgi:hypothetical protein
VHPSWRDLVIDELVLDRAARRRFLARAELDGVLLALAIGGGRAGERVFPLLVDDGDWDLVGDRAAALARDSDDHDALRLLAALETALGAQTGPSARDELFAVAGVALGTLRRRLDRHDPPAVAVLAAWLALANRARYAGEDPAAIERTWFALMPGSEPPESEEELRAADDWLWLVQVLGAYRNGALRRLGFPERHAPRIRALVYASETVEGDDRVEQALRDSIHRRLAGMDLGHPLVRGRVYPTPDPEWPPPPPAGPRLGPLAAESTVARILRDL